MAKYYLIGGKVASDDLVEDCRWLFVTKTRQHDGVPSTAVGPLLKRALDFSVHTLQRKKQESWDGAVEEVKPKETDIY